MLGTRFLVEISAKIQSCSVLRIGDEDDTLLIDQTTGMPLLPASGIAGAFRSYLISDGVPEEKLKEFLGNTDGTGKKSRLFIEDALGTLAEQERRARVSIDSKTGAAKNKGKFDTLYLAGGNEFLLKFTIEAQTEEEKKVFSEYLYRCLAAVEQKHIRFGAQKTNGAGEFTIQEVKYACSDLYNRTNYVDYLLRKVSMKDITKKIKEYGLQDRYICIEAGARFDTPVLVAGMSKGGSSRDKTNIKNKKGEYYIPGSSLKGVLRSQCERICSYFDIDVGFVSDIFGTDGDKGRRGMVTLSDAVVNNPCDQVVYHQIAADRFTGGTMMGSKFAQIPVQGEIDLYIWLEKRGDGKETEKWDASTGLLLLAVRDLLNGLVAAGSGHKIGFGQILSETVQVTNAGKTAVQKFGEDSNAELQKYVEALKNYQR